MLYVAVGYLSTLFDWKIYMIYVITCTVVNFLKIKMYFKDVISFHKKYKKEKRF